LKRRNGKELTPEKKRKEEKRKKGRKRAVCKKEKCAHRESGLLRGRGGTRNSKCANSLERGFKVA